MYGEDTTFCKILLNYFVYCCSIDVVMDDGPTLEQSDDNAATAAAAAAATDDDDDNDAIKHSVSRQSDLSTAMGQHSLSVTQHMYVASYLTFGCY